MNNTMVRKIHGAKISPKCPLKIRMHKIREQIRYKIKLYDLHRPNQLNTLPANNCTKMPWNLSLTEYYHTSYRNITNITQHNTSSTVHLVHTATRCSVIKQQVLPQRTTPLFTVNIYIKIPFFWDMTLRDCVIGYQRFERNLMPSASRIVVSKTNRYIGLRRQGHYATSKRWDRRHIPKGNPWSTPPQKPQTQIIIMFRRPETVRGLE
jgi:hypothetical protein